MSQQQFFDYAIHQPHVSEFGTDTADLSVPTYWGHDDGRVEVLTITNDEGYVATTYEVEPIG